jgi:hypothetical protein
MTTLTKRFDQDFKIKIRRNKKLFFTPFAIISGEVTLIDSFWSATVTSLSNPYAICNVIK